MKAGELKKEVSCDWMRPEKATIQFDATLEDAVSRMNRFGIHHLIVMDGKTFVGLLSVEDQLGEWDPLRKVGDIMRTGVPIIDERSDLSKAVSLMVHHRMSALPLKRGNEVCGIITSNDLLNLLNLELLSKSDLPDLVKRTKELFTRPIVQSISQLLSNAGI